MIRDANNAHSLEWNAFTFSIGAWQVAIYEFLNELLHLCVLPLYFIVVYLDLSNRFDYVSYSKLCIYLTAYAEVKPNLAEDVLFYKSQTQHEKFNVNSKHSSKTLMIT